MFGCGGNGLMCWVCRDVPPWPRPLRPVLLRCRRVLRLLDRSAGRLQVLARWSMIGGKKTLCWCVCHSMVSNSNSSLAPLPLPLPSSGATLFSASANRPARVHCPANKPARYDLRSRVCELSWSMHCGPGAVSSAHASGCTVATMRPRLGHSWSENKPHDG